MQVILCEQKLDLFFKPSFIIKIPYRVSINRPFCVYRNIHLLYKQSACAAT